MASEETSFSCPCLNVRVNIIPEVESMKIHVMHYRLIDFILYENTFSKWYLVCLLCQRPVYYRKPFLHGRHSMTIKFHYEPFESVVLPVDFRAPCVDVLTHLGFLKALNSPSYSSAFRVLNTILLGSEWDDPTALNALRLDRYPTQLADIVSDLCDVAIRHNQQLRHEILLSSHTTTDSVDIVSNQVRTRSDFHMLCKELWDRRRTAADSNQKFEPFNVFIGAYLARMDNAFSGMRAKSRRDSSTSVDSMEAITLEGISDRYLSHGSPKASPGHGFGDLPTETAWKIFRYLEPVYLPGDLIAVQDYHRKAFAFAQLSLVSKSWSRLAIPSLYRHIALFSDPVRLHRLSQTLKAHGPLVRVVVIDDINIGPVHIRTCSRYIDKCLSLCPNVLHVQCNGDIGLESSRMHTLPSLRLVFPIWLPVDMPAAFRFAGPDLQRLDISKWYPYEEDESAVLMPSALPQLRALSISDSVISVGLMGRILDSITRDGTNVLRELSISNIRDTTLDGPSIPQLLKINMLSAQLTVLRIRLPRTRIGTSLTNDDFLPNDDFLRDTLPMCPSLIEFSYRSPTSSGTFAYLPHTLRTLELGVVFPYLPSVLPTSAVPRVSTVQPFIDYLRSPSSRNLEHLSIIRQALQWDRVAGQAWRRLDTQSWDWQGELQGICKERNIQFSCSFVLDY